MPYAHGAKKEDIYRAAEEIYASGQNPTMAKVRANLGSGSFSTISKYLSEWKADNGELEAVEAKEDIPEEINLIFRRAYTAITNKLEANITNEQVELLEDEIQELNTKLENYEKVKAELEGAKSTTNTLLDRIQTLIERNQEANSQTDTDRYGLALKAIAEFREVKSEKYKSWRKGLAQTKVIDDLENWLEAKANEAKQ